LGKGKIVAREFSVLSIHYYQGSPSLNSELKPYVALVDFLADFLGEDTEIVLHDLTDLEHSVVAIRNNHISGRKLGAPVTDLVLQILHDNDYSENNYLCNYKTHGKSGNLLKSGTFFIKNKKNKIIGILCLNMDIQKLYTLRKSLDALLEVTYEENITKQEVHEILGQSVQELTLDKIEEVVRSLGVAKGNHHLSFFKIVESARVARCAVNTEGKGVVLRHDAFSVHRRNEGYLVFLGEFEH